MNWWEIGEDQFVHLTPLACKIIFNEILQETMWGSCKKIRKVFENVKKRRKFQAREKKVAADYKYITEAVKREGYITLSDVKKMCKVSDNLALARLLMLSSLGVLIRQRIGKKIRYYLAKRDLPEELPSLNTIRREVGWR